MNLKPAILFVAAMIPTTARAAEEFRANDLYVAAKGSNRVVSLTASASAPGLLAMEAPFIATSPRVVAFAPDGLLYVSRSGQIDGLDAEGIVVRSIATGVSDVRGLAFGPGGDIFVLSGNYERIDRYRRTAAGWASVGGFAVAGNDLRGLAISPEGTLYIGAQGKLVEMDIEGALVREINLPTSIDNPWALVFGANGHLYVSMYTTYTSGGTAIPGCVYEYLPSGIKLQSIGEGTGLERASGLAFGPDQKLYVSSHDTNKIHVFDPLTTEQIAVIAPPNVTNPVGLAFAPQRFKAKLSGSIADAGEKIRAIKENVVVSVAPGSNTVMIDFVDADETDNGFDDTYFQRGMVFHGFESFVNDVPAKKRIIGGTQIEGFLSGVGSLSAITTGKVNSLGNYEIKNLQGNVGRHGASGGLRATLKTTKQLNKKSVD